MEEDARYVIQVVVKAVNVLLAFDRPPHVFTTAQLARRTRLTQNQVFRCLRSLIACGVLHMDAQGRYALTPLLRGLVEKASPQEASLVTAAAPAMDHLAQTTGETVNLFAFVDDLCICVDYRLSQRDGIVLSSRIGKQASLHAGACPKAVLAFLPEAVQREVARALPRLPRHTPATVTDPERLRDELRQIRFHGYAISDEDSEAGARGVGAPVFGPGGGPVGGISLGGPVTRVSLDALQHRFAPLVLQAAKDISRRLGYNAS